jgi:hypothetical protein
MIRRVRLALQVVAAVASGGSAAIAAETCSASPYTDATGDLSHLVLRLTGTLAPYPSLAQALVDQAPVLCLDDSLVEEQGYFEPKTNRIVLSSALTQDFQLAILIHEVRHLEQYGRDACPTISYRMTEYVRSRLALEADASAVGIFVAWKLREGGDSGPWDTLATWPTHDDLVARFADEMAVGADEVAATAATFTQWFESADRREIYTFAICSNYLDALDREKVAAGQNRLPDDYAARLCVLPDGRPYSCTLPP